MSPPNAGRTIRLHPITGDAPEALLCAAPNTDDVAKVVRSVWEAQQALYRRTGANPPWMGYLAADPDTGALLGSCSFVVGEEESVEIAYFTFPPFERQGVATAMVASLTDIARANGQRRLHAFTLRESGPSTHILGKAGFTCVGDAVDADAGPVWRWERADG